MAVPTSALNELGQIFERKFIQAWEFFQTDRFDSANEIAQELVSDVRVGNLHRAGCHLILAHSPDDYVFHAEQALALFKDLYADERYPPNEEQKELQEGLITTTKMVLKQARSDAKTYALKTYTDQPELLGDGDKLLDSEGTKSLLAARRNPTEMVLTFPIL